MEKEAARGSSGAGFGAVARCEDAGNFFEGELAAADVDHGADQIANHVVKEAVAADAVDEKIAGVG